MVTKKAPKNAEKFECIICDFTSSKHSDYKRHVLTRKHETGVNGDALVTKKAPKNAEKYECKKCSKLYASRNGLWSHSKKCIDSPQVINTNEVTSLTNLVLQVVKQNQELTNQIIELSKHNNVINNNCTTNNKFNLQVFLHEQCKDALNISEFIDSLQLTLSDLENVGTKGFVYGIYNIFVNGLK